MPLPERRYFPLTEVAERWAISPELMLQHSLDGLVEISVMVVGVCVQIGYIEEGVSGFYPVEEDQKVLTGPQPLRITDLWKVLRDGSAAIAGFKPKDEDGFIDILPARTSIQVSLRELLITRAERDRFENEHQLRIESELPAASIAPPTTEEFIHSPSFERITWNGISFRFGARQAAIVRQLFEAAKQGDPWVSLETLLTSAGSKSRRLVDLFKTQKHWRLLIQNDGKGRYRLALTDRKKAYRRQRANPSRSRDNVSFVSKRVGSIDPMTNVPVRFH